MKPAWDNQVAQLRDVVRKWDAAESSLQSKIPVTNPNPPASKEDIRKALTACLSTLEAINVDPNTDSSLVAIHQAGLINVLNGLTQAVSAPGNLSSPAGGQALVGALWGLRSMLVWFPPSTGEIMQSLVAKGEIRSKGKRVLAAADGILSNERVSTEATNKVINSEKEVLRLLEEIRGHEREASTAKTNAQASAAISDADKQKIDANLTQLSEAQYQQAELQKAITELRDKAEEAFRGASRIGLAKSFSNRAKTLKWVQGVWAAAFFAGIGALVYVEHSAVGSLDNYRRLIAHVLLGAPLIWWTWFSVRQYGQTARLMEDYAFKEASALAFDGYRREMSEDGDMIKLLREAAIRNFGANPVRIFGKSEPGAPLHHLLETALDKIPRDQLVSLIKTFLTKD